MNYKVIKADKTGQFEGKFGIVHKITLVLEDPQGTSVIATLNQKPETPLPSGSIEGEVVEGKYGKEFKKETRERSGGFAGRPHQAADYDAMVMSYAKDMVIALITTKSLKDVDEVGEALKRLNTLTFNIYDVRKGKQPKYDSIPSTTKASEAEQPFPPDDYDQTKEIASDDPLWEKI